MAMRFPEYYRAKHPFGFAHKQGDPFGWFLIPLEGRTLRVMADGADKVWEHVSVSLGNRCPTWSEMHHVKRLFWDDTDTVVQYHPPTSEYVNIAQYCLHMWRYKGEMPRPPKSYV